MKKYKLLLILLSIAGILNARTGWCRGVVIDTPAVLKIGDKVPDLVFSNVQNYNSETLRLSDFKGKIVVLDFWATWCGSCLEAFPYEYALQEQLSRQLQIVLVDTKSTRDKKDKVARFFSERRNSYSFPSLVEDTVLDRFFPHRGLPHFVILKDNVVISIPDVTALTRENIEAIYENKHAEISQNIEIPYDLTKQLFIAGNGGEAPTTNFHSSLYAYKRGLPYDMGMPVDSKGDADRIYALNHSRLDLILFSFPNISNLRSDRIILRVSNPSAYLPDSSSEEWRKRNLFIYEATFPSRSKNAALAVMAEDIRRYFCIHSYIASRDTTCIVLSVLDSNKIGKGVAGLHLETNFFDHFNNPIFFRNSTFTAIAGQLEDFYKMPVINDCNYHGKICLNLPANLKNFKAIGEALKLQGIKITVEKRAIPYLVIEDEANSSNSN